MEYPLVFLTDEEVQQIWDSTTPEELSERLRKRIDEILDKIVTAKLTTDNPD